MCCGNVYTNSLYIAQFCFLFFCKSKNILKSKVFYLKKMKKKELGAKQWVENAHSCIKKWAYIYMWCSHSLHIWDPGTEAAVQTGLVSRAGEMERRLKVPCMFLVALKKKLSPMHISLAQKHLENITKTTEIPICNSAFLKVTVTGEPWPSHCPLFRWFCLMFSLPWDLGSVSRDPCPQPPVFPAPQLWAGRRCWGLTPT